MIFEQNIDMCTCSAGIMICIHAFGSLARHFSQSFCVANNAMAFSHFSIGWNACQKCEYYRMTSQFIWIFVSYFVPFSRIILCCVCVCWNNMQVLPFICISNIIVYNSTQNVEFCNEHTNIKDHICRFKQRDTEEKGCCLHCRVESQIFFLISFSIAILFFYSLIEFYIFICFERNVSPDFSV